MIELAMWVPFGIFHEPTIENTVSSRKVHRQIVKLLSDSVFLCRTGKHIDTAAIDGIIFRDAFILLLFYDLSIKRPVPGVSKRFEKTAVPVFKSARPCKKSSVSIVHPPGTKASNQVSAAD